MNLNAALNIKGFENFPPLKPFWKKFTQVNFNGNYFSEWHSLVCMVDIQFLLTIIFG